MGLGARIIPEYTPVVVSGLTFLPVHRTDDLYTGFFQDEISLLAPPLIDRGNEIAAHQFCHLRTGAERPAAPWSASERQSVWLAFTHAVRTPSDAEENFALSGYITTTSSGVPYFARFNPNPAFAPEQLNGSELGYRLLIGKKVYVDIATFFNHYHNLFSEDFAGATFLEDTPPPRISCFPLNSATTSAGIPKAARLLPNGGPPISGGFGDRILICT